MNLKNCIVNRVSTLKDWSVSISLITRLLTPQQLAELFISVNQEIMSIEIDETEKEVKSQAQRLRWVLYKLWENSDKDKYPEFPLYYSSKMERIIEQLKEKIND